MIQIALLLTSLFLVVSTTPELSQGDVPSQVTEHFKRITKAERQKKRKRRRRRCKKKPQLRRCDGGDFDGLMRWQERKHRTNPWDWDTDDDGLSDGDEVKIFKTDPLNPDTDGDGILDGDEDNDGNGQPDGSQDGSTPGDSGAGGTCDLEGNTSSFGIPEGLSGNITAGEAVYESRCVVCHAGVVQGEGLSYVGTEEAIALPPMFITLETQELVDLVAYLNALNCELPGEGTPAPTPTPGDTPTPTPTPGPPVESCFDAQGDTSEFSLPNGVLGNYIAGQSVYETTCASCHPGIRKGENLDYPQVQAALALPVMQITLQQQALADLVAYLNMYNCPNGGGPTPTPTPSDPIVRGQIEYQGTCASCHGNANEFAGLTVHQLNEAIADKDEMNGITYTMDLILYLGSLGGGNGDD